MLKKQSIYRVTIITPDESIVVKTPLTAQMNIVRSILTDSTRATVKLYNLSPTTRSKIFQDTFVTQNSKDKYIIIEAGYGDEKSMSLIFKGRIMQAFSAKSGGETDIITEIQAQALDALNCYTSRTVEAGTSKREAIMQCANDMPNVNLANIGAIDGTFLTPTTFVGNTLQCINEIAGGYAFIDNGNLNVLLSNEVIDVPVPVVGNNTTLLDTPMRRDANLTIKMLFEPELMVGQLLEVKSEISPDFNGQFKVMNITHDLTFGEGVSGTRTTIVDLWVLPELPTADRSLTDSSTETADQASANAVKGDEVYPVNPVTTPKWIMPCKGVITSPYGWRIHPTKHERKFHAGIDIYVPVGTPVKAIADGKVYYAGNNDPKGYGKYVVIDHGKINGVIVTSEYGHLSRWIVSWGQVVKQGQIIAYSGNEGKSTNPHLHLTIKRITSQGNVTTVDPLKYIKTN